MDERELPVILAVDSETSIASVAEHLERRYYRDYRVLALTSALDAVKELKRLRDAGEQIALALVAPHLEDVTSRELLARTAELHPQAKRALLVSWGDWADDEMATTIREAVGHARVEYYVLRPWRSPDELFHRTITEFLHEWSRGDTSLPRELTVVADPWSPRGHEIQNLLTRNGVPHVVHARDSEEGQRLLREVDVPDTGAPVVFLLDGRVLVDPSNAELARGYGVDTELEGGGDFDVVIIGAGPAGLAAAVYAASEGVKALVVEREAIGGQAGSSSRIRNYLGFARGLSGAELAQRAYQQAWVFGAQFLLMREVTALEREDDGRYAVTLSDGSVVRTRAVVLAMGVAYRRLGIEALERLADAGVYYGASPADARQFTGCQVYVVGGGNSAGQCAVYLSRYAAEVTIAVREPTLEFMSEYLREEIDALPNVHVVYETQVVDGTGEHRLETLTLRDPSGERVVPADALFVLIGAEPHTDWLPEELLRDDAGYLLAGPDVVAHDDGRWPLDRPPLMFETSMPAVFAVGDARSGSVKRVASAVGEGSVVIQTIQRLFQMRQ